ncbi:MAG: transporter permease [Candidatus Eremiobacteraeota bacterium]|nr:transporter permease [Candidatus Eremiobacteraeota bacterium]
MSAVLDAPQPRLPSQSAWQRRIELVRLSAVRQLRSRYRGSALGVLWSFANPVLLTMMYTLLFGSAFASSYGGSTTRYVVSAFVAVVVVTFFLQATSEALVSVVANGGLLNKIAIDPETFPFASVAANAFQQALTTFPAMLIVSLVITHDPVRVILVPIVLAAVVAMAAGFGIALAALYVFFRDLSYLWAVMGFLLWMTSPVFYPAALVPESIRAYLVVNPVAISIAAVREVTIDRGPLDAGTIGLFIAVAAGFAILGHLLFRGLRREFMDLL